MQIPSTILETATEMALQILSDFVFDHAFKHRQQKTQLSSNEDFMFSNRNAAVYTRSLEVNHISIPAVINVKLSRQIAGKIVRGLLGISMVHLVKCANINRRHHAPCCNMQAGQC